jgi:hypothetical protein
MSIVNYLTNRLLTYPITKEAKGKELNIIQDILHNNEYNKNFSTRQTNQHKRHKNTDRQHQKTKWAIFTQVERKQRKLQNSLRKHK